VSRVALNETALSESDVTAVLDTLRSGWLTMGPRIQELEQTLVERFGAPHAVTVSSGTAALQLALLGVGVEPGDEVILPALSFVGGVAAARFAGAEPVLCDVRGADDPCLDVDDVAARITPRTKAVVAVHLLGYGADVGALRTLCAERGIALVEDAGHAIGARLTDGAWAGTVGDAGCFSLSAGTQLGVGEGGFVLTADEAIAGRVRSLRSHAMTSVTWDRHRGHANTYDIVDIGFNFRLDEPRAALALSRLPRLDAEIERRRGLVRALRSALADAPGVGRPWDDEAVALGAHHRFAILLDDAAARDRVRAALAAEGVESGWAPALSALREYRALGPCPRAEDVAGRWLALPLGPSLGAGDVSRVADVVRRALA
jgi:dTDP-4-amino-4,6-dideoxygalactose transaminase